MSKGRRRLCGIVLAAGRGRRMGRDKALVELGGRPAVQRVAEHCRDSGLDVLVVRRAGAAALPGNLPSVEVGETGEMIDSLRAGARALPEPCGFLVFPVDYAMVAASTVRSVAAALREGGAEVVLPLFEGRPGHPIGLSARLLPEVLSERTETLRQVIRRDPSRVRVVAVDDPWVLRDLDRPADLRAARAALASRPPPSGGP